MVIWLTGLSGAGKTTIGKELHALLKATKNAVFIDGDDVRAIVGDSLGYDIESRKLNAWRISRFCRYLESQDINVVCSTVSMFEEIQQWNRENFKKYFEILIDVPMEELIERDQKGLYTDALSGKIKNVMGIDIQPIVPIQPEMIIKNTAPFRSPVEIAKEIFLQLALEG